MPIDDNLFGAFMLAYREHGPTGLGLRKCLEAYEAAKTMTLSDNDSYPAVPDDIKMLVEHHIGDGDELGEAARRVDAEITTSEQPVERTNAELMRENTRLKTALSMAEGNAPCSKWKTHQGVNSMESFIWWVDTKLREYLMMGAQSKDDELTDWVAARSGTFEEVKLNLTKALEGKKAPKREPVGRSDDIKFACEAMLQILDDGDFIHAYEQDDTPIFTTDAKILTKGGGFCGAAGQQLIEAYLRLVNPLYRIEDEASQ